MLYEVARKKDIITKDKNVKNQETEDNENESF
jgi:hypothetical protein